MISTLRSPDGNACLSVEILFSLIILRNLYK